MYETYKTKMNTAETKMLRMLVGVTKLDKIRNTGIWGSLHIKKLIAEKLESDRLSWYCNVHRRPAYNMVKIAMTTHVPAEARKGAERKTIGLLNYRKSYHSSAMK